MSQAVQGLLSCIFLLKVSQGNQDGGPIITIGLPFAPG